MPLPVFLVLQEPANTQHRVQGIIASNSINLMLGKHHISNPDRQLIKRNNNRLVGITLIISARQIWSAFL